MVNKPITSSETPKKWRRTTEEQPKNKRRKSEDWEKSRSEDEDEEIWKNTIEAKTKTKKNNQKMAKFGLREEIFSEEKTKAHRLTAENF